MTSLLDRAAALADDVLYPAATEVDASGVIPPSHFAALAGAGLDGLALAEPAALPVVTEVLAAGCLATTFTWMQHHGPVRTLAALGDPRLADAAAGGLRCRVALAGAVPDPPLLRARRVEGGWRLDGEAPLVSGWGLIDLVQLAARDVATADAPDEAAGSSRRCSTPAPRRASAPGRWRCSPPTPAAPWRCGSTACTCPTSGSPC